MTYHVNPKTGDAGQCGAKKRCPFGGEEAHYSTPEDARKAYEAVQSAQAVPAAVKKDPEVLNGLPGVSLLGPEDDNLPFPKREEKEIALLFSHVYQEMGGIENRGAHQLLPAGSSAYDKARSEYRLATAHWLNLTQADERQGLARKEYNEYLDLQDRMDKLALSLDRPSSRDYQRAKFDLRAQRGKENVEREWAELNERFPTAKITPLNAAQRRAELNRIRLEAEGVESDYRMAHPSDSLGLARLKLTTYQIELEEAQAEFASVPAARTRRDKKLLKAQADEVMSRVLRMQSEVARVQKYLEDHSPTAVASA